MARRSNRQSKGPSLGVGLIVLVVLLGGGFAAFRMIGGGKGAFHGLTHLNVSEYLENSKSLQGNVYKVEGRVEDQLAWSTEGRLLSVVSQGAPMGIKVPAMFSDQNIQTGQTFAFKVLVGAGGILIVQALEKA